MKSFNDVARATLALGIFTALSGCGALGGGDDIADTLAPAPAQSGPAADYPVVVGAPYRVDGVLHTPVDTLNYDEVGYALLDGEGGDKVTVAHHTLPLPSYAEVTSLATGRTILVRVERRGPMADNSLIALSPGAAVQLGATGKAPVRVRRVNPPEAERAALRLGGRASDRLETPETLLTVLRRRLPGEGSATLALATPPTPPSATGAPVSTPAPIPVPASTASRPPAPAAPTVASPGLPPLAPLAPASTPARPAPQAAVAPARPAAQVAAAPATKPPRTAAAPAVSANGKYTVQAGAYSTSDRAQKVAGAIGGTVSKSGTMFRVRTGPYASRAQAEASLAKVKAAGYSEARIFTNG